MIEMLAYPVNISMSAMRVHGDIPHRGKGASGRPGRARCERRGMLGHLYDRALGGERCWIRHEDGEVRPLPAHRWLGARCPDDASGDAFDEVFDEAVTQMCTGPTIELGCGPGRLIAKLIVRGIPALGIDRSATAIRLAGRGGAPALLGDVFEPLHGTGLWQTVLLVDGNVGLGGDPRRILGRAAELLGRGGRCVAEFDTEVVGVRARWVRLESARDVGPWFRWASVGVDSAAALAAQVGLTLTSVRLVGGRVIAILAAL
jgi:SAM-dependent methyltransferase